MTMREQLIDKLLAYLNGAVTEQDLIAWAEDQFVAINQNDEVLPEEDLLLDILGYIGAADDPDYPLTWEALSGFLGSLGVRVRVTAV